MTEAMPYNTRIYTDVQGLQQLQSMKDTPAAKKEVALQFEAILMQMVLHSMRDANKSFAPDGLFGSDQMDLYQDMFDKQLTLLMSNSGTGFASIVEKSIDQMSGPRQPVADKITPTIIPSTVQPAHQNPNATPAGPLPIASAKTTENTHEPNAFLKKIWPAAKKAAIALGVGPEALLAQVVLETNWGKSILAHSSQDSSHNLFNIKADNNWKNKTVSVDSLEERNHVLVKEKSNFRSYASFEDSFMDYVNILKQNGRYHEVLQQVKSPEKYFTALQQAGFATDSNYANKILNVFSSQSFKKAMLQVKNAS